MDPNLKVTETKIELVDDTKVLNEDFKKNVAIPYFKDIYKDLVQQSDQKSKGINKLSILTVSAIAPYLPCSLRCDAQVASCLCLPPLFVHVF